MALIQLPQRFLTQPQYAAPLDPAHWITKDTDLAINFAAPNFNAATGQRLIATPWGAGFSRRITPLGTSLYTPNGGWAEIAVGQDWTGPNTVIAVCRVNAMDNPWGGLFSKNSTGWSTQFAIGRDGSTNSLYGSVDDATALSFGGSTIASLTDFSVLAFTHSGAPSSAMSYYHDGRLVGITPALGTAQLGTGPLVLGSARDFNPSYDSDVDWIELTHVTRVLTAVEIAKISSNVWAKYQAPSRRLYFTVAAGGTTYNQSIGGSVTAAGALTKQTGKAVAGSSTAAGTLARQTGKGIAGFLTGAGGLVKQTTKTYTGSITGSGAISTMILFTASFDGSITPSGAIAKLTMKALAGTSTLAGAITKKTFKALDGNISIAGVLAKLTTKAMSGSITATGAVTTSYQVLKSLAGSITPTGALGAVYIAFVAGVLKLLSLMGVGQ